MREKHERARPFSGFAILSQPFSIARKLMVCFKMSPIFIGR